MLSYNTMGSCVLVLTLAAMLVAVLLLVQQRTGKTLATWLMSGLTGIVLGAAGYVAAIQVMGMEITEVVRPGDYVVGEDTGEADEDYVVEPAGGGEASGTAAAGEGRGGRGGGGRGGMGGGMGSFTPPPKRLLTSLVLKVELLTSDIALNLTEEQAMSLAAILNRIAAQETMTDDEATVAHEEILAIFDEGQRAKQDAVGLPFGRSGRGGPGGGDAAEDANPFAEETNAAAIKQLLTRLPQSTDES